MVVSPDIGLVAEERRLMPDAEAVEFLDARGSDRDFRRVHGPAGTVILMRRGDVRAENARFSGHTRFLARQGLRVPGILWESADGHTWCLEDLGRVDLLRRGREGTPERNRRDMRKALSVVARLHARRVARAAARLDLELPFRPALYAWEHQLFLQEFLARHDPGADAAALEACLGGLSQGLADIRPVLLHRDLQSTNMLWHQGAPALIDYQGMRLGPAAYDLGSLLADPYVAWPLADQLRFLGDYNRKADAAVDASTYRAGAMQRLCQALGAYGRLGAKEETRRFLAHIPAAVRQIRELSDGDPAWETLHRWATRFLQRQPPGNRLESEKPL
jgi:aminoglycoside/choline kinase family phosphotransferase